ncbi:MAG: enoyl-CoA hydratase/isomerase family protein [Acidimicrobiales bacterium]
MTAESVQLDRYGTVRWLRMNRPEALNAFDAPMIEQMRSSVAAIADDPDARVVVLCGNGRSFSTGVDVKGLASAEIGIQWFRDWHQMTAELEALEIPVIAAIQGHCLGGGVMLTLAVDYRIAADNLSIGLGAVRHGILPGSAPKRLASAVGWLAARRLCLFGEYVDATDARRMGLVDRVVALETLEAEARAVAERVAGFSSRALRECKRLLALAPDLDDAGYEQEYLAAQARCLAEPDR